MKKENRVLLCAACNAAVQCLSEDEVGEVCVITASDGSLQRKVLVDCCGRDEACAWAEVYGRGLCYRACAEENTEGITLMNENARELTAEQPGLVTLLLQNICRQPISGGVSVSWETRDEKAKEL